MSNYLGRRALIPFAVTVALMLSCGFTARSASATRLTRASRDHPAFGASKRCTTKWVHKKVHGKKRRVKVRICVISGTKPKPTPTPTSTPTPTPTPTPVPATVTAALVASTPGYTLNDVNGAFEITDATYGDRIDIDQMVIARDPLDPTSYVLSIHVTATKIPSSMDAQIPDWNPGNTMFTLVASNQHPYPFYDLDCSAQPGFQETDLYDGESTQGWMCSDDIAQQYVAGTYTLVWQSASYNSIPILDVAMTAPSS